VHKVDNLTGGIYQLVAKDPGAFKEIKSLPIVLSFYQLP
jgi:hypothetical protein